MADAALGIPLPEGQGDGLGPSPPPAQMEKGGGGTISQYMARFGMKVLDMGTPLLNMHAPWELASKFDCWQTYRAYSAYLRSK